MGFRELLERFPGCPVCGYPGFAARRPDGGPTYGICSCCSFQSGVDLAGMEDLERYATLRGMWQKTGYAWWSPARPAPPGWDAAAQLRSLFAVGGTEAGERWARETEAVDPDAVDRVAAIGSVGDPMQALRLAEDPDDPAEGWYRFGNDYTDWPPEDYVRAFIAGAGAYWREGRRRDD